MQFNEYIGNCERTESLKETLPMSLAVLEDRLDIAVVASRSIDRLKREIYYRADDDGQKLVSSHEMRMLHGMLGVFGESGELIESFMKRLDDGKLDVVNLGEEIGDLLYYVSILISAAGLDFAQILNTNILKLQARYGDAFSHEKATNRDISAEREILEREAS